MPEPVEVWDQARWAHLLDRIEHRCREVGLRFWGPPLWLEVTMSGPDSDTWLAGSGGADRSWDWQSPDSCPEVAELIEAGAGDDRLLAVVSRYAVENLILNAVHEVGEWLRFDGDRCCPAHRPRCDGTTSDLGAPDDVQGNGSVHVDVSFPSGQAAPDLTSSGEIIPASAGERFGRRIVDEIDGGDGSGYTYVPGTSISLGVDGLRISWGASAASAPRVWRSGWSSATMANVDAPRAALLASVGRDVHRAIVVAEADRICRAFHIDGHRRWRIEPVDGGWERPVDDGDPGIEPVSVEIRYLPLS